MYSSWKKLAILVIFTALVITIVQSNDQCACGLLNVESRISHGSMASPHKYPWIVLIKVLRRDSAQGCTGSLIDDRTILTAAHCVEELDGSYVKPFQISVFLGITIIFDAHDDIARPIEAIFVHPERNITLFENDIALLRMENSVEFVKNIRPACLPKHRDESVLGKMKVAGFGFINTEIVASNLQEADIDFVDEDTCLKKVQLYESTKGISNGYFSKTILCGKGTDKTMICGGDSGGPLMHSNEDGRIVIAGVSQFIKKTCGNDADVPDMYANVGIFIDFIQEYASGACFVTLS